MKLNQKPTGSRTKNTSAKRKTIARKGVKSPRSKSKKQLTLRERIWGTRRAKVFTTLAAVVFISAIGFIGSNSIQSSVVNAVSPLGKESCEIRGRDWKTKNGKGYCSKTCLPHRGKLVRDTYDYCKNTVTSSISKKTCHSLGRKWLAYNGCARYYLQLTKKRALQCSKTSETYHVAKYDYCGNRKGAVSKASKSKSGGGKGGWTWPMKSGLKGGPCYGGRSAHAGMDINTNSSSAKAYAMASGKVVGIGRSGAAGNNVWVKTNNGYYYWYQHLKSIKVRNNQKVYKGDTVIGIVGKTGNVRAPNSKGHLHIVVSKKRDYPSYGALRSSINPMKVLPKSAPSGYKCY